MNIIDGRSSKRPSVRSPHASRTIRSTDDPEHDEVVAVHSGSGDAAAGAAAIPVQPGRYPVRLPQAPRRRPRHDIDRHCLAPRQLWKEDAHRRGTPLPSAPRTARVRGQVCPPAALALAYRPFDPAGDHQLLDTTLLELCERLFEADGDATRGPLAQESVHAGRLVVALPAGKGGLHPHMQCRRRES
jgi:hypothetical protein